MGRVKWEFTQSKNGTFSARAVAFGTKAERAKKRFGPLDEVTISPSLAHEIKLSAEASPVARLARDCVQGCLVGLRAADSPAVATNEQATVQVAVEWVRPVTASLAKQFFDRISDQISAALSRNLGVTQAWEVNESGIKLSLRVLTSSVGKVKVPIVAGRKLEELLVPELADSRFGSGCRRVAAELGGLEKKLRAIRETTKEKVQTTLRSLGVIEVRTPEEGRAIAANINDLLQENGLRLEVEPGVVGNVMYDVAGNRRSEGFYLRAVSGHPKRTLAGIGFATVVVVDAPRDGRRNNGKAAKKSVQPA